MFHQQSRELASNEKVGIVCSPRRVKLEGAMEPPNGRGVVVIGQHAGLVGSRLQVGQPDVDHHHSHKLKQVVNLPAAVDDT